MQWRVGPRLEERKTRQVKLERGKKNKAGKTEKSQLLGLIHGYPLDLQTVVRRDGWDRQTVKWVVLRPVVRGDMKRQGDGWHGMTGMVGLRHEKWQKQRMWEDGRRGEDGGMLDAKVLLRRGGCLWENSSRCSLCETHGNGSSTEPMQGVCVFLVSVWIWQKWN